MGTSRPRHRTPGISSQATGSAQGPLPPAGHEAGSQSRAPVTCVGGCQARPSPCSWHYRGLGPRPFPQPVGAQVFPWFTFRHSHSQGPGAPLCVPPAPHAGQPDVLGR